MLEILLIFFVVVVPLLLFYKFNGTCWHKWGKWEVDKYETDGYTYIRSNLIQHRICSKCNFMERNLSKKELY